MDQNEWEKAKEAAKRLEKEFEGRGIKLTGVGIKLEKEGGKVVPVLSLMLHVNEKAKKHDIQKFYEGYKVECEYCHGATFASTK